VNAYEQLLADRVNTCAGVFLAITRQCPLACAHCSTRSRPDLPPAHHHDALVDFVRGIRLSERPPRHMLFTGGEPFLHPQLLVELSDHVHRWGGLAHAITGGFFARASRLPPAIRDAIKALDSISLSWDRYHEEFVTETDFLRMVSQVCDVGPVVSLQVTVDERDDSLVGRLRAHVPNLEVFVSSLGANGRARDANLRSAGAAADSPCAVATWPVVSYTGAILACCNQDAVDEAPAQVPAHLLLGQLGATSWVEVVERRLASSVLRCIEAMGPAAMVDRDRMPADTGDTSPDRCTTCRGLCASTRALPEPRAQLVSALRLLRRQWFDERRRRA
jgi:organic radical activating enzyme